MEIINKPLRLCCIISAEGFDQSFTLMPLVIVFFSLEEETSFTHIVDDLVYFKGCTTCGRESLDVGGGLAYAESSNDNGKENLESETKKYYIFIYTN